MDCKGRHFFRHFIYKPHFFQDFASFAILFAYNFSKHIPKRLYINRQSFSLQRLRGAGTVRKSRCGGSLGAQGAKRHRSHAAPGPAQSEAGDRPDPGAGSPARPECGKRLSEIVRTASPAHMRRFGPDLRFRPEDPTPSHSAPGSSRPSFPSRITQAS